MYNHNNIQQNILFDNVRKVKDNTVLFCPNFHETDKYLILFYNKGASSFINSYMEKNKLSIDSNNPSSSRNWYNTFTKCVYYNSDEIDDKHQTLTKIVRGDECDKDIIIVTRNPINRFISGIYQDLILYITQKNEELNEFGIYNFKNLKIEEYRRFAINNVYNFLNGYLKKYNTIITPHSKPINLIYFNLLNNNDNFNFDKLKIINIDNPNSNLRVLLDSYHATSDYNKNDNTYHNSSKNQYISIVENLSNGIKENDNRVLNNSIDKELGLEYYYYNLLNQKYKKYFV